MAQKPKKDTKKPAVNKAGKKPTTIKDLKIANGGDAKKVDAKKPPKILSRREQIVMDRAECYKCAHALVETIAKSKQPEGSLVEVRRNLEGWMRQYETQI